MWVRDPADLSTKTSLLSNEFDCSIVVSGVEIGDDKFMSFDLKVTINGGLTWTADATTGT